MNLILQLITESPAGLVKTQTARPNPGVSDLVGLGWGSKMGIFNKFPSGIDICPETTL